MSTARSQHIGLTSRFRLAVDLATALFEFHKINWLHKSISSHNVVFFSRDSAHAWKLESPFITGFSHSRLNEAEQYSNLVHDQHEELRDYLHPTYRNSSAYTRYTVQYDYYSLGLVLLEIGCWRPLKGLIRKEVERKSSTEEIKQYLINTAKIVLPSTMGEKYSEAVVECLTGCNDSMTSGIVPALVVEEGNASLKFERLVIRVLASCSV